MASDLKGNWKETGVSLGHAFRDLGKTLIKTGATAMKKADNWANGDNEAEKKDEAANNDEGATQTENK